jgi:hypothetical protein
MILNQADFIYSSLASTLVMPTGCHSSRSARDGQHDDVKRIGDLAFTQLAELRHRGAFSTVSQTFAACCLAAMQICPASPRESDTQHENSVPTDLLQKWYQVCDSGSSNQTFLVGTNKL